MAGILRVEHNRCLWFVCASVRGVHGRVLLPLNLCFMHVCLRALVDNGGLPFTAVAIWIIDRLPSRKKTKERRARHNEHFLNARCFCFARLFYLCGSAASCHDDYEGVIMRCIMHNRATSEDDE